MTSDRLQPKPPHQPQPRITGPAHPATRKPNEHLIVALDVPSAQEALALVDALGADCLWYKVGLELFYAAGPALVHALRARQLNVFLDLKLHDIPNTVAAAVRTLSKLDVQLLTVHASGGAEMLAAAQRAAQESGTLKLLGVTVLTSMNSDQLTEIGVAADPASQVLRLSRLTQGAGLPGLVCSALEVSRVRATVDDEALLVVPGIRPASATADDQKRIATPAAAIRDGASMLVVGRPITRAVDPRAAANAIFAEIATAM